MNEPKKPWPPSENEYWEKVERRYIYGFKETLRDEDYEDEDDEEDEEGTAHDARGTKFPKPSRPIEEVDLGWLLAQLPEGIKPEQVKIEFGYNASSMAYEDHYIRFYYEVTVPARWAEFKAALKKYQEDAAQYVKDLEAYKKAKRQKEIEETEAKLARLKNGK